MSLFKKLLCIGLLTAGFVIPMQTSFMSTIASWAWLPISLSEHSALSNHKGKILGACATAIALGYCIKQNTYKSVRNFYDKPFFHCYGLSCYVFLDPKFCCHSYRPVADQSLEDLQKNKKDLTEDCSRLQHNIRVAKRWNNHEYAMKFEAEYQKRNARLNETKTELLKRLISSSLVSNPDTDTPIDTSLKLPRSERNSKK